MSNTMRVAGGVSQLLSLFSCLSPRNRDDEVPLESEMIPQGKELGISPYSVNSSTSYLLALLLSNSPIIFNILYKQITLS